MISCACVKQVSTLLLAALAVCLAGSTVTMAQEQPEATSTKADSVAKILLERRAVLEELVHVQLDAYRANKIGLEAVVRARRQLLTADLELETRPAERIKLTETFVKTMADWEELAMDTYRSGRGTLANVLQAKASRLEAQAQVMREQEK